MHMNIRFLHFIGRGKITVNIMQLKKEKKNANLIHFSKGYR